MLYGQIKPTLVKIVKQNWRYPSSIPMNVPLRVISWNMKFLLVADERVVKVYKVLWKSVELVESEKITQIPFTIQQGDQVRVLQRLKEKHSIFKSKK